MRSFLAMALLTGAAAFSAPSAFVVPTARNVGAVAEASTAGIPAVLRATPLSGPSETDRGFGFPAITGAAALLAVLGAARRRQQPRRRQGQEIVSREAQDPMQTRTGLSDSFPKGAVDKKTGKKNYVNPWEQRITGESRRGMKATGWKFYKYEGPVYKKVPVVEGLQFPLDPKKYYPPLQPPPPGAKWGDGRSPDGNWYDKVDGKVLQYWQGVGRRKCACAIVRIFEGTGQFIINGREAIDYMKHYPIWWLKACEPLAALSQKNKFDILCNAFGGGLSGQAGAIRLALARAMQEHNFNWRPLLKRAKYLTRDPRMKEMKKTGQPGARKKTPWHKR
eukprot:TRINITY_DN33586_c0_g1_i2.p1 TRINITY_DN33586_c0_g1~~TRINITY_DN33586_c0_g1_i2.p1  ORF type:complete len:335 (-),score=79.00 TRINITY_DN33586_c0_g1_i2:81-1085(-)